MAKKIRNVSGSIYCSYCGTAVDEEDTVCSNCSNLLDTHTLEGKKCEKCDNPVEISAEICPKCGVSLSSRAMGDDEYLSKLLGWVDDTEKTLKGKIEEKQKALDTFRKVTGVKKEDVGADLEVVREPLQKILEVISERLEKLDMNITDLKGRMESEGEDESKFEEIKKLSLEKDHLIKLEEAIDFMSAAFENMYKTQHREIEQRKNELSVRVKEFKRVVKKKEEEKNRIEEKRTQLIEREEELKKWENQLRAWEEDIINKEEVLQNLKSRYEKGGEILEEIEDELPTGKVTKEEWLKEQKKIQRELFKLRDMWEEDGDEGMVEMDNISGDNIQVLKHTIRKKEEIWKSKIHELEEEIRVLNEEKNTLNTGKNLAGIEKDEIETVLQVLDKLLGDLPEDKIEQFARSKDFKLYEKIMEMLEL